MAKKNVFVDHLVKHFQSLKNEDPSFSLNKFSKALNIKPGPLSEMLNGKRAITFDMALKIAKKIAMPAEKFKELTAENSFSYKDKYTALELSSDSKPSSYDMGLVAIYRLKKTGITPKWLAQITEMTKPQCEELLIQHCDVFRFLERTGDSYRFSEHYDSIIVRKDRNDVKSLLDLGANECMNNLENNFEGIAAASVVIAGHQSKLPSLRGRVVDHALMLADYAVAEDADTKDTAPWQIFIFAIPLRPPRSPPRKK